MKTAKIIACLQWIETLEAGYRIYRANGHEPASTRFAEALDAAYLELDRLERELALNGPRPAADHGHGGR